MNLRISTVLILMSLISLFVIYNIRRQEKVISPLSAKVYKTPSPTSTPTSIPALPLVNMEEIFEKYANQYSVAKDLLKRIAICESGLNPNATNLDYGGLFQFSESPWISIRQFMNLDSNTSLRFNTEESIKTAAFLISRGNSDVI